MHEDNVAAEILAAKTHPMTATDLRLLRRKSGLTLKQVARGVGVIWVTVWRWEKGKRRISPQVAVVLRRYFRTMEGPAKPVEPAPKTVESKKVESQKVNLDAGKKTYQITIDEKRVRVTDYGVGAAIRRARKLMGLWPRYQSHDMHVTWMESKPQGRRSMRGDRRRTVGGT